MKSSPDTIETPDEYKSLFGDDVHAALDKAHDLRKFEIELYWKRATYFWTIIALAFAGFFAATNALNYPNSYVIGCLGLTFSVGWYLVNRASSAAQRNWELHARLLEDAATGPLHKVLLKEVPCSFWDLAGPYPLSISRLNAILSLMVVLSWILLLAGILWSTDYLHGHRIMIAFGLIPIVAFICMLRFAKYGGNEKPRKINGAVIRYL